MTIVVLRLVVPSSSVPVGLSSRQPVVLRQSPPPAAATDVPHLELHLFHGFVGRYLVLFP